ncbi:hypothetical protein Glove_135g73 [Diversispora epigaea]|uniref:Uncharacterized protein n=1 Tax=Diversispora epigaea TaxID=1348612 RepID=A0A397J0P5_9GLOM|nr:hypothetical protein Glove_135g73 [Diversispora epigaea]
MHLLRFKPFFYFNQELHEEIARLAQSNRDYEHKNYNLEKQIAIREERIQFLENELESVISLSSQEREELQKEISDLKKSLYQARKEIRQKEKDLAIGENQLGEFDIREKKLKHRIKELSTSGRNSPQTYNQLVEMTDTIEQLRNENQTLRQYLTDRNNQIARQKGRITDLHCQNFTIRLLHYRDKHELQNMRHALQTADETNQNLYNMLEVPSMERSFMSGSSTDDSHLQTLELGLEEASQPGERQSRLYDELMTINITRSSSEESQNLSNSSGSNISEEMGTIAELANTIDGYLDNPRTNRTILSNQIKRATSQIRRKYDNLQTDLINEQQRRYNAEAERDLRQTDLDNALNDLNLMTTAYNNERVTCQQYFLELQQCRIRIDTLGNDLHLCDIQLDLKWGKWKNRSRNAEQLILNLQGQILLLQNNQANMTTIVDVMQTMTPLLANIPQYIGQENPEEYYERILRVFEYAQPVIASANANVNNTFVDANKCDVLKTKMAGKYTPVPGNDPYTAGNPAINTPATFLAWLKGKYSTETVGSKRMAERFLSQEQFNPTDTPDMYKERIRPYLTYIAYADLLPYLYDHLPENIEVRMRINPPADINAFFISLTTIYRELNQKQAFQVRQNKKHQQNDSIIPQPIVSQPASSSLDMEKRFQDELAKRDAKYEADIAKRDAEMKKLKADFDTKMSQQSKIQSTQSIDQPPALPPGREYRRDEYYTNKFMDDNERRRNPNWGGDINDTLSPLPNHIQNQSARIKKLENDIHMLWGGTNETQDTVNQMNNRFKNLSKGDHTTTVKSNRTGFVPLQPIFNNDDENGYNEEDNIWHEPEKKNEYQSSVVESKQNKVGSESHCPAIVDSPVTTFDKLFPESDDQLLKLLSPAMRDKIMNPSSENK